MNAGKVNYRYSDDAHRHQDRQNHAQSVPSLAWHSFSPDETLGRLDATRAGLSHRAAEARRLDCGWNELPEPPRPAWWRVVGRQFRSPLIYILLAAMGISIAFGHAGDSWFIGAVLVLNAAIGATQEWQAETSARALRGMMTLFTVARRDAEVQRLAARELVPGDVILLTSGDAVPADARLLQATRLQLDESLLTGESAAVHKRADVQLPAETALAERSNLVHAGTMVVEGQAQAVVVRVGLETEVGRIARALTGRATPPPLLLQLEHFTRQIGVAVGVATLLLGAVLLWRGEGLVEIFFLAVALAVSAVPEGLPVAVTVVLARASRRMARRNVIVRLLPAVEGLGACTLIASDKTGTLTANRLTLQRLWIPGEGTFDALETGIWMLANQGRPARPGPRQFARLRALARSGALASQANLEEPAGEEQPSSRTLGDPVDVAFLRLARRLGFTRAGLDESHPMIQFLPFSAQRRSAASFHTRGGSVMAHVKGAPEVIFSMCALAGSEQARLAAEELARQGYRVLGVAAGCVSEEQARAAEPAALRELTLLGLAGLIDPVRPEVPAAVERCRQAGVEVCMVTGDHPSTALTIARRLGIATAPASVVTGRELAELAYDPERLRTVRVFARVEPAQKRAIVDGLQQAGHCVAVTGDGVNDAPALRQAFLGVAMGRSGTDVARQAADLILTDDNFASLVDGIEEGRIAYANIRKVTLLLISTGAAEILLFFLSLLSGLPMPLTPVQLLWLNLVTNGLQDVALGFEAGEPDVLRKPPRSPQTPLFERRMMEQTLLAGTWMGCIAFALFAWLNGPGRTPLADARNLVLLLMVLFENVHALNCRSETQSVLERSWRANRFLVWTIIAAQALHLGALHLPLAERVLGTRPVRVEIWLLLLITALSLMLVMEIYKVIRRR